MSRQVCEHGELIERTCPDCNTNDIYIGGKISNKLMVKISDGEVYIDTNEIGEMIKELQTLKDNNKKVLELLEQDESMRIDDCYYVINKSIELLKRGTE